MVLESHITPRSERISAEIEQHGDQRQVKIRVESFDARLGWYSSGALTLTPEQMPLLEQAIAEMRQSERARHAHQCDIIPFPSCENAVAE